MQAFAIVSVICWFGLAAPATVSAQSATPQPAPVPTDAHATGAAKPTPPADPQPPAPTGPAADISPSLFEQTWHQVEFGGRFSNVDGDPARFQRYTDIRDGVLFTDARYAREDPAGAWLARVAADNVGWRDQRFFGEYERPGRFVISGVWDEIPQFYSVDTKTPYTGSGGTLVLDDAAQRQAQAQNNNLNVYVPVSPQFELHERRDIGNVQFKATP